MSKIDSRFIPKLCDFTAVDGYAYTGTEIPAAHNKSNIFLNTEDGTYSILENDSWSTVESADKKTFLSANDNMLYSVNDGNVTSTQPENSKLYFAVINQKLICCYNSILYVI